MSTCLCCSNRLVDAVTACHIQQEIYTFAVSELQYFLCPLRGSAIVHTRNSAQLFYSFQIGITAGGDDNLGSQSRSNLCCKNRNTSRPLNQNSLAGLDLAIIDERIPRRQRSNRKGRGLLIGHVVGCTNRAVFMDDHVLRQTTRQWRAEAVVGFIWPGHAVQPT
ncbi:hypothetical protein D3C76_1241370 [compost metagenome]